MSDVAQIEMPKYKCHKEVHALKLAGVDILEDGSAMLCPADKGLSSFEKSVYWAKKFEGEGKDPGYFVIYKDGYQSWSPTKEFEEDYTEAQ